MTELGISHPLVPGGLYMGPMNPTSENHLVEFSDKNCTGNRVRQIMIIVICETLKKVYRFEMAIILLSFLSGDCAIPRKLKNHFPEG